MSGALALAPLSRLLPQAHWPPTLTSFLDAPDRFDKAGLTLHIAPPLGPPNEANFMVSETTQTKRRRHNRDQRIGVKRKRRAQREGTPSFPLDPASGVNTSARTKASG